MSKFPQKQKFRQNSSKSSTKFRQIYHFRHCLHFWTYLSCFVETLKTFFSPQRNVLVLISFSCNGHQQNSFCLVVSKAPAETIYCCNLKFNLDTHHNLIAWNRFTNIYIFCFTQTFCFTVIIILQGKYNQVPNTFKCYCPTDKLLNDCLQETIFSCCL